jgi:hypothetical protein
MPRKYINRIWKIWKRAVGFFSWTVTRVYLTVLYFSIFTVYSIVIRISGMDPLDLSPRGGGSYWTDYVTNNRCMDDFRKKY